MQISAMGAAAALLPVKGAMAQPLALRRSVHEMDLDDPVLVALRDFVRRMKDPARNGQPVSWVSFANIHGTDAGFNLCPHGNWYFLPWHRGYVHMYEQAVRNLTGQTDFAMPYWDWSGHPDFPAAFGDEVFDGQPNPLFVPGRAMRTGDRVPTSVSGPAVLASIMSQPTLEEFGSTRAMGQDSSDPAWISRRGVQGELESNPHNNIHCMIDGPFMCEAISPQDPIFQMHHCNIDRLWDAWNRAGGPNSSSELWLNTLFRDNYITPDGRSYSLAVSDLLAVEPLGYTYQAQLTQPQAESPSYPARDLYLQYLVNGGEMAETGLLAMPLSARSGEVTAEPDKPGDVTLQTAGLNLRAAGSATLGAALQEAGLPQPRAKLFLRDLRPKSPHGTMLRVFVNTPDAGPDTPTEGNPNYVTSIGFFGTGRDGAMLMVHMDHEAMDDGGPTVAVDIPAAAIQPEAETISVQLVPMPLNPDARTGPVVVTQLELAVL